MTAAFRLTSEDAAWLQLDRPANPAVINSLLWFDRPLRHDTVVDAFARRLVPIFPRFAQRILDPTMPIGLIPPSWADAEHFDVRDHIRSVTLPALGDDAALRDYVSAQAAIPLDRERPLWETHLIGGYGDGSALLLRSHHAMADGAALVQAVFRLVDDAPDGRHPGQLPVVAGVPHWDSPWQQRLPRLPQLSDLRPGSQWGRYVDAARSAAERNAMLVRLGITRPDDDSPLRGELSGRKQLSWSRPMPLDPLKEGGRRYGATVNDLALAAIAGALRRYLLQHGSAAGRLTALVPINLRAADEPVDPLTGGRSGLAFVALPIGEPDAQARVAAVKTAMDAVKRTGQGVVTAGALAAGGHAPPAVEQRWLDLLLGHATVVVTNVPGPREPVSLTALPLRGYVAWMPTTGPVGVGLSFCSYAGRVRLGAAVDEALVPDGEVLLGALSDEVTQLAAGGA